MKQKMYINLYVKQRLLAHKERLHLKWSIIQEKNVYDKYLLKNVQDHARKS